MDSDAARPQPDDADDLAAASASDAEGIDQLERFSLARNLAHMLASQLATWILTLALTIFQPRFLGPEAIGQMRLALSLWLIAAVFINLGTGQHLTLLTARDRSTGIAMIGPILVMRMIVFVVAAIAFAVFLVVSGATGEFAAIMGFYALFILFAMVSDTIGAAFVGLERMSVPASAGVAARVFGTVVAIIVLLLGGNAVAVVAVAAGGNLIGLIILVMAIRGITTISFRGWRSMARPILQASFGFLVASAILVIYQQVDTVVIAVLVEDEVLGWYGTADTLFSTLLFPITILMGVVFPTLGRLHTDDPGELIALVKRSFRTLLMVAVPIGLGTTIVAQQFAPLLLGEEFEESGDVLAVFGPVILLTFGSILFATIAMATERQMFWNAVMFVGVVLTIPLDLIFVPWADSNFSSGAIGGALAYLGTESMMVILGLWKIAPYLLERSTLWRTLRTLLAGGLMFAAAWPLRDRFLLLPIAVGALVYPLALSVLRVITDAERQMVGAVLAKVGLTTPWATIDSDSTH